MSGINIPANIINKARSWLVSLGYTLGPAIIAYNLMHFRVSKSGYYFLDVNKYGLTIGVFMMALAIYLRKPAR